MDTRTGNILTPEEYASISRRFPKVGRNEPCPCGKTDEDGKPVKFKRCCLNRQPVNRTVEVFRGIDWHTVRLVDVRKGERFRMWEGGRPVTDKKGRTEWVATVNGFINGRGVGAIETEQS